MILKVCERRFPTGAFDDFVEGLRRGGAAVGDHDGMMSQVVNLLNLSPAITERLVAGKSKVHERTIRATVKHADWSLQERTAMISAGSTATATRRVSRYEE